jgi:hypothetical protein
MLSKMLIVYILVNGSSLSHSTEDIPDKATCIARGDAWVEQWEKRGYDTSEDNATDYNRWSDYECIVLPVEPTESETEE